MKMASIWYFLEV